MALTRTTTHVADGQAQLISQFVRKPNFRALLGTYLQQVQELEDVFFQLLGIPTAIEAQEGAQLDLIGKIVGQERDGRSDTVYRRGILARLAINRASGLYDEFLTVLALVAPGEISEIEEFYPAGLVIRLLDAFSGDGPYSALLLGQVRVAGVHGTLEYSAEAAEDLFVFSASDSEELSEQGFASDATSGEAITNGDFSAWTADDPDDWTAFETWSDGITEVGSGEGPAGAGSGSVCINRGATAPYGLCYISQAVSGLGAGASYAVRFTISRLVGSDLRVQDSLGLFNQTFSAAGTYRILCTPSAGALTIYFATVNTTTLHEITIDSVSLAPTTGGVFAAVEEM
jgi:hypothetical protein